jgi:hypothetical protein
VIGRDHHHGLDHGPRGPWTLERLRRTASHPRQHHVVVVPIIILINNTIIINLQTQNVPGSRPG